MRKNRMGFLYVGKTYIPRKNRYAFLNLKKFPAATQTDKIRKAQGV